MHQGDHRRALILEWTTIAWNSGEVFITIALGVAARSLALIAFGLDSVVEVFASLVVVWHIGEAGSEFAPRTRRALRLVGSAFAVLAVLLTVGAVRVLIVGHETNDSPWGIAYLGVTAVVMFVLATAKRRVARRLDSEPLHAEATMTTLDGFLALSILGALAVDATLGWWWADPVATLVVAGVAANEAREAWEEAEG